MKERTEVPVEQTWDLTLLFKTEEDYKKSIEFYKQLVENFCKNCFIANVYAEMVFFDNLVLIKSK